MTSDQLFRCHGWWQRATGKFLPNTAMPDEIKPFYDWWRLAPTGWVVIEPEGPCLLDGVWAIETLSSVEQTDAHKARCFKMAAFDEAAVCMLAVMAP